VNYPNEEDFTRITEFKNLTGQKVTDKTTILKEYPLSYSPESEKSNPPYYPISNSENLALYKKYSDDAEKIKNLFLCGRLAQYKYFNMDGAVASALSLAEKIASK
jgi:UDP-galactopyranose mutase